MSRTRTWGWRRPQPGRRHRGAAAVVLAVALVACGGPAKPKPIAVPERAATAGDGLLAALPAGADVVIEIDVARLRANPTVGPLLAALAGVPRETLGLWVESGGGDALEIALAIVTGADVAVMASYRVGSAEAATLIAVRGEADLLDATDLGKGIKVAGPAAEVARARAVVDSGAPSLAGDRALMAIRAVAMPAGATGAWLRVAGRFDFEARVSLASRLELDYVPVRLSVWGDVADDLALIALMGGDRPDENAVYGRTMKRYARRAARAPLVRALGLQGTVERARIDASGELARAIVVVSPARLGRVVDLLMKQLSTPPASKMPPRE